MSCRSCRMLSLISHWSCSIASYIYQQYVRDWDGLLACFRKFGHFKHSRWVASCPAFLLAISISLNLSILMRS